jgi:hypothetical protein
MLGVYKKSTKLAALGISLVLGIKAVYGFPLLFLLKNKWFRQFKFIILTIVPFAIYHLPFLIANPYALYKSMLDINLSQQTTFFLQVNTTTFGTFINRQFSTFPPSCFFYVMLLFWLVFFWLIMKKGPDMPNALVSASFVFITILFWGPIAMANYYFFASVFLLFALAFTKTHK